MAELSGTMDPTIFMVTAMEEYLRDETKTWLFLVSLKDYLAGTHSKRNFLIWLSNFIYAKHDKILNDNSYQGNVDKEKQLERLWFAYRKVNELNRNVPSFIIPYLYL